MATIAVPAPAAPADDLLLKVTPPRAPRNLVTRARLRGTGAPFGDAPLVLVQAPAGFGKTSLLAQWRLEFLAQGAIVAWLLAQARDEPQRLVQALALAVRVGASRPGFGHTLLEAAPPQGMEAVTLWLAEVAHLAFDVVLIVDDADRLPAASGEALGYLLRNAPPNLRVVVGARSDAGLELGDLVDYGQCLVVGPAQLRFTLDETLALARERAGSSFDADAAARLHELTEGWPLGVQLAMSVAASAGLAQLSALPAQHDGLRERLMGLLLAHLDPADLDFLTRIAVLDHLHPQLCAALTGADDAAARLARLARDTPVFVVGEHGDWLRMHALARTSLRERCAALPAAERAALHARAAQWLAAQGLLDAAARHALAAGQNEQAYELAERSLYDSIMARGRQAMVLDWLAHLPAQELDKRPRLLLAAAWSLATSDRHQEAGSWVERILAQVGDDKALRCECALIASGAAVFADDPDHFAELHDPWASQPPLRDAALLQVHANRSAFRTLLQGDPALARLRQQQAPRHDGAPALGYAARWGELIVGLTYLWEGQVRQAEDLLTPTLMQAEEQLGRRSPFVCMVSALLAAAVWERGRPQEATALLANRLDVLERHGLPEAVMLGFRTIARIAVAAGEEHRALELLGALHAVGRARALPRLTIASLAEQARLHSRRFRSETCRELCAQIDAVLADPACPKGPLWLRSVKTLREQALGWAAIAAQDWRRALEPLQRADALAQQVQQGRLHIELLGLRAFVLDRCGERTALPLLREAMGLAQTFGLERVFADAHPGLDDWVRQQAEGEAATPARVGAALAAPMRAPAAPRDARLRGTPSLALTPKEREVLALLANNLSNKEIGLAMQVGEETIKWHMKNLLAKLDAGNRKQVVSRARILGLLEAA